MRSGLEGVDHAAAREFAIENGIVGTGWGLNDLPEASQLPDLCSDVSLYLQRAKLAFGCAELRSKGAPDHAGYGICGTRFYPRAAAREMEIISIEMAANSIFKSSIYAAAPILTCVSEIHPTKVTHLHLVAEEVGNTLDPVVIRRRTNRNRCSRNPFQAAPANSK
jgi:hypothetical protein